MGERRRRARCHTPDKVPYRYQPEAEHAAIAATAWLKAPMEAYQCPSCDWWHLTRVKPPRV